MNILDVFTIQLATDKFFAMVMLTVTSPKESRLDKIAFCIVANTFSNDAVDIPENAVPLPTTKHHPDTVEST